MTVFLGIDGCIGSHISETAITQGSIMPKPDTQYQ